MYISYPKFDYRRITPSLAGSTTRPFYQELGGLHGTHSVAKSFPDPNECWRPGSTGKPDWSKTIFTVEAALEIPATCKGSIIARTTLRDPVPGMGASNWAEVIRFGTSDGTSTGGLEKATRVSETLGIVEFENIIPWDGTTCTTRNDIFVYVKYDHSSGPLTFIEIGYYPRLTSVTGVPEDKSLTPVIRLNPCDNLAPIRSPYVPRAEFKLLPQSQQKQINKETDRVFREETGVARKLDMKKPKDRPLSYHWLRIRDSLMGN